MTRNVQRAGPKARKGSARASLLSLSLSLPLSFFSLVFSSLPLINRNVQRAGPKARKGSARAALSLSLLFTVFSFLLSSHHFRSPLSLSFTDRTRERAFGTQRQPFSPSFPPSALPLF